MAKGNMLLGQAYGKVGSLVFSRLNGQQVIKPKASKVNNPRTDAQMIQRILMNTIIQAYSKMSSICDHSFEGVKTGQMSMSYFVAKNIKKIRYQLAVTNDITAVPPYVCPLGITGLATNDFVIAKGTLAEIIPDVTSGGVNLTIEANTYAAVIAACNAKRGDQITVITVNGDDISNQKFVFSRIILDPLDNSGEELPLSTPFLADGAINAPHPRNENNGHLYSFDNGVFTVAPIGDVTNMGCVIASRQSSDGSWLRSNAVLLMAEGEGVGYSMEQALAMFEAGGIDTENPRYLNNAAHARKVVTSTSDNNGGGTSGGGDNGGGSTPAAPSAPVITQSGDGDPRTVTITGAAGASIYYTTDGSQPSSASTAYSQPFTAAVGAVVKAIAVKDGQSSTVSTLTITAAGGGNNGGGNDVN